MIVYILAIIVEDDTDLGPYAWRWLREVFAKYRNRKDVMGATVAYRRPFKASNPDGTPIDWLDYFSPPQNQTVFMYRVIGTWGFAPHPSIWRNFQDWYTHTIQTNRNFVPLVPGILMTEWYKGFIREGTEQNMWEQNFIYYTNFKRLYCIFDNLQAYAGHRYDISLSVTRNEKGK